MEILVNYILPVLGYVISAGTAILALIERVSGKRAKALNAILTETKRLVAEAEVMFAPTDALHKSNGSGTAGGLKKSYVINALRAYCLENGIDFTIAELDKAIEEEVAYTKTVNAKNA